MDAGQTLKLSHTNNKGMLVEHNHGMLIIHHLLMAHRKIFARMKIMKGRVA